MKKHFPLIFFVSLFISSCSHITDNIDFLRSHGIKEVEKVPTDYTDPDKGWKKLADDYVYFMDVFDIKTDPKLMYIIANKREGKLIGAFNVNPYIMPAAIARDVTPSTIVTNYEEISPTDIAAANDMAEINKSLKAIPELKNFTWKNELQNTIVSGIFLKTNFIFITKNDVDDKLFNFQPQHVIQDHHKLLEEIFKSNYTMYHRAVERLNDQVEMNQFIKKLGFKFENDESQLVSHSSDNTSVYINDLLINDQINFKGPGKMFFFFQFKSFTRITEKGGSVNYSPAVETYEYTFQPDKDGFPEFKRNTHFVSLLGNN
jgi:hypothetical protein